MAFLGRGFDTDGDGSNDVFIGGKVNLISVEEAKQQLGCLFWLIGWVLPSGIATVLVMFVVPQEWKDSGLGLVFWMFVPWISFLIVTFIRIWLKKNNTTSPSTNGVTGQSDTRSQSSHNPVQNIQEQKDTIWLMKLDGTIGGPFTKEKLRQLKSSGKLPPGLKASRSKDGPWKELPTG